VADEAHRQGLPLVGHGLNTQEIVKSVILGYSVLEHASGGLQGEMLQLLAQSGTQCDPTLSISGSGMVTALEPQRLEDPKFLTFVPEGSIQRGGGMFGRMPLERRRAMWQSRLAQIRTAHEHGVNLRAGTDALMGGIYFGPSLHWELEHFAEAGLPPIDVIRMATLDAAETVGAQEHLGSLEAGKLGDLVLLDESPLEQVRNTQTIWRVIKGGRVFDPATLRE
jgi:imidazolonepropionase-like amidohydrolase